MKKIFDRTEYNLSWARITMVIFMAFVTGLQSYGQEADRISGATQVCDGETESYRYTGSSGFKRWTIVGSYTLVGGTTVTSNPISIRWKSNGTLDVVPIAPPPADFGISVTLHSKPTVRISGPVEGRPGETVTMTASGASGYYWEGPGLQSTTGQTVSAILPDYDDFVYMVEGYQGYCSGTDSHFIKVLLVDAGPDRIYCRDAGSIDLNEWGLSLTEGQWSGPALTGNVIDLSALAPGEYIYRYTRKDGAHDSIILSVIESIGGSTSLNVFDNCGPLTGRITLSGHTGNITSWEKSYDDGQTWQSISSTANPFEYFENVGASFRAVVKYGTCTAARSERVTISPALANVGTISSSVEQDCNTISGSLALTGSDGLVHSWEKTYDNISWASVPDATANPLSGISENSFVGYRAVVQAGSCPVERTEPVFFEPLAAVGGFLQSTSLNITCESATGTLALQGAEGDSYEWKQSTDGVEWTTMAGVTGTTFNFDISVETQYQVVVRRGDCQPATSSIFTVHVSSQGGKATVTAANQCGTAKGNVVLSRWIGNIVKWQTSTNNTLWEDIPGSEDLTMLEFTTSAPVNYYRAVVQSGTCPEVYSTSAQVNVSSPTKPGIVRLVNDPDFELVSGAPVFKNVEFQLYDYHGNIQHWTGETNAGSTKYAIAAPALTLTIDKTTAVRAQVKSGVCDPLLSGQAIFVVNKKFQGILSLFGQRTPSGEVLGVPISEYTGYSYQVSGPGGVSLKEGFSFHANRAQNFFVLLDDNYAVPPPDQNSARDEVVLKEGIRDEQEIYFLNSKDRSSTYTYYDGLERPIQKVHRRISPNDRDLVVALGYDGFGRQVREYLPYEAASNDGGFQENAIAEQRAFYLAPPDGIASSEYPYAVTVYEQSPLNRVTERGSAGSEWQPEIGHTLKLRYETNFANEVINWKLSASGLPVRSGFYQAGTLVVDVKVNEQGNSSKEYKDKLGRVILKRVQNADEWLDTYCVYDEFNLKRFEIQPEGVAILGSSVDQAFLDQWAFQYRYNERRLQVAKRIPGAGWVFNVYDDRDRLVLSQDANQRTKNQWTFIKYDHLNRPVLNGLYTFRDPHDPDHIATPDEIRAKVSTTFFSEEYTGEAPFGYSINRVFPTEDIEVLTANYYDDYTFCTSVVFDGVPAYDKNALTGLPASAASLVKGMPTGNMVRILDSDKWLRQVTFYDKDYRVIQTISEHHLGGYERISQVYDFSGDIVNRSLIHVRNGSENISVTEELVYDNARRLVSLNHKVDGHHKVNVKRISYNSLGQFIEKNLHAIPEGFMQSIDYRYNIRGWLTHINNPNRTDDGGQTNDDGNDYFGAQLYYQEPNPEDGVRQFTGSLSQFAWGMIGSGTQAYLYRYDNTGRFLAGTYVDKRNPLNTGRYSEAVTRYDRNGNILKLERRGAGAETLIDDLTFTYNGNRLLTVTDSKNNSGFADGNKEGEDYKYDENGNMVVDHNKEVSAITYNHLNLPVTVTKKNGETLTFTYDGAGKKLTQTTTTANGTFVLDYAGSAVYHNNQPAYLNHEEGRVILGDEISYEYFLRDHLGNTRLAFTTKREQETSTATLDNPEQDQTFLRYDNVRRVRDKLFDHTFDPTDGDGFAVRLTGGEAEKTGLAKSVEIMPGDKVHMEVYGKYVHPNDRANWAGVLTNLIDLIASGVNGSVLVDGVKYGSSDNSLPIPDREPEPIPDGEYSGPPAYLNYVFIPIDGNLDRVQFDVRKLSAAPRENGSDVDHEKLELDFTATETGLLYVYLSNDNEQPVEEVFFDDFSVTHIKSPIIQHTSYYPFGLAFDSYQREHTISQRSKFQGQEHIDDLGLDWDAFKWRNHQPEIGRFFNVDPLAEKFPYNSPYAFSENKITNSIELEGLEQVPANEIWDIHVVPVHSIGMLSSYFYTAVIGDYYYELFEITSGPNKGNFYARSYLGRDENNNRVYQWDYVIGKDRIDEVKGKKTETLDVGGSKYNAYAQAIFFGAFDYNSYENPSFENLKIGKWIYDQWTTPENYVFGASMWVSTLRAYTKSSLRLGRQMHEAYKVGQTGLKEFRLPSGKRIDFLDVQNGIIYELKPYNPRAMQQGQQQLQTYLRELQSPETLRLYPEFRGIQWRTVLDTY